MSQYDLVTVVPSYGRPDNAWRLRRAFNTSIRGNSLLIFVTDEGSGDYDQYPPGIESPTRGMIPALNNGALAVIEAYNPKVVCFMGDDHLPVTHGWDVNYLTAIEQMGGTGIVYGNDLIQGPRIPTQVGMSANIISTLGWMAPPSFKHLFVDDAWLAIGKALNRVTYLPNTVIQHLHPLGEQAEWDAGYERVNSQAIADHDRNEFQRWRQMDLPLVKSKLQRLL